MGKQKKRNAFFYFMVAKKPEVEKRLKRKVEMSEMAKLVTAEWQALPEEQWKKYQLMTGESRERLDCRGVPLRCLDEAAQEKKHQAEEMKRDIADLVDMYRMGNALHQASFILVSTSYYAHTDHGHYVPAELSLLRFSLRNGIMKEFHCIVAPIIPLSYAASARKHSLETHKLLSDSEGYGNSLEETAKNLKQFLSKDWDEDVPVYTLHRNMEQAQQMLKTVTGANVKIFSLDLLYRLIYSAAMSDIPLSVATDMLEECGLDYFPNIACSVHNTALKDGARFCTLSHVRRWVYFMCQNLDLKKLFGVEPQKGKHYPVDELWVGASDSLSSLTLEDSDKACGAVGSDPWVPMDGKGQALTTKPWEEEDFPSLGFEQAKKGSARGGKKKLSHRTLEMD
ncbi:protein maelstrom-like isoform X2 [Eriocheir sinensis]|uniref:protein maelstrom-like isoform X1 n=1 Tax=Eriocheir sinensis TaxID=95602 RepID=UPI0021C9C59F|nr:protein maelstrom-like isoform X1 [Eriocheir sinensis]XP_050691862.1 protein maelstrom-like isoform X2 [Eriocheir sinensis]